MPSRFITERITPFLAVELGVLKRNIVAASEFCDEAGLFLRPHFKAHKMAEVAILQLERQATGISVSTINEAVALNDAGIQRGILITSELVGRERIEILKELLKDGVDVWVCIESIVGLREIKTIDSSYPLSVLIDVDLGTNRTGVNLDSISRLVAEIAGIPNLNLKGLQTYQGHPSGIISAEKRRDVVLAGWDKVRPVISLLKHEGFSPQVISGGNTATFEFDVEAGVVTELQLGGYVVGDEDYDRLERLDSIKLSNGRIVPNPAKVWEQALRIVASVVSVRTPKEVIIDAGLKSFSTDRPQYPVLDDCLNGTYKYEGDEFGRLIFSEDKHVPHLGEKMDLRIQHCDPTVNLYSEATVFDVGKYVGTWEIIGRHPFKQRIKSTETIGFYSKCLHAGYDPSTSMQSRAVPIYPTVAYILKDWEDGAQLLSLQKEGFTYSRISNPTVDVLEKRIASLEGGGTAVAVASGMSAVSLALLNLCQAGDNFIATNTLYGGTRDLFKNTFSMFNIETRFSPVDEFENLGRIIDENTRAIFTESMGNPLLDIPNFDLLSKIAHSHNIPLIVDNTLPTPALMRVRDIGGNIAIYSASKNLGGHGTTIGGIIVDLGNFDWATSNNPGFINIDPSYRLCFVEKFGQRAFAVRLRGKMLRNIGSSLGPFEAWNIIQGVETLKLRMIRHSKNALAVARYLQCHSAIDCVNYPGLTDHPYYTRCQKYMTNGLAGSTVFFTPKGGLMKAKTILERCTLISHMTQLGDARTCIQHPASTSHQQIPEDELLKLGLTPGMLRLSVGLEDLNDIVSDLKYALL
jgi:O-acetylhomoserine (thiol)-lyase